MAPCNAMNQAARPPVMMPSADFVSAPISLLRIYSIPLINEKGAISSKAQIGLRHTRAVGVNSQSASLWYPGIELTHMP